MPAAGSGSRNLHVSVVFEQRAVASRWAWAISTRRTCRRCGATLGRAALKSEPTNATSELLLLHFLDLMMISLHKVFEAQDPDNSHLLVVDGDLPVAALKKFDKRVVETVFHIDAHRR